MNNQQDLGTISFHSSISLKNKRILFVSPHPDDDVIGCGALLFYLSKISTIEDRPQALQIAYAVSGFNGVSDQFVAQEGIASTGSVEELRASKTRIRRDESTATCNVLGTEPIFWDLPFYEARKDRFDVADVTAAAASIKQCNPDIIFLIDEATDPHGTHGVVRSVVLQALKTIAFTGTVVGYRVWEEGYFSAGCDITLAFDETLMQEKEKLVSLYRSQIADPAYPHKDGSFIDMMRRSNTKMAKQHKAALPYLECYKILKYT